MKWDYHENYKLVRNGEIELIRHSETANITKENTSLSNWKQFQNDINKLFTAQLIGLLTYEFKSVVNSIVNYILWQHSLNLIHSSGSDSGHFKYSNCFYK